MTVIHTANIFGLLEGKTVMKLAWYILFFFAALIVRSSYGFEILTHVNKIDISEKAFEPSLIFLASGHVLKLYPSQNELLQLLQSAKQERDLLKFTSNEEREITNIAYINPQRSQTPLVINRLEKSMVEEIPNVEEKPTVLKTLNHVRELFKYARINNKESQCFNRAHVWSYEWKADKNINTAKMFIFFSVKYIREHNFHWWFHVAPYSHVVIGNKIKERILDKKYLPGPSTLRQWIDRFMENGTKCRTVKLYSDYANYPESGECYLMRSNMYTYWPHDLEKQELDGTIKYNWVPEELHIAYSEAFDITIHGGEDQ